MPRLDYSDIVNKIGLTKGGPKLKKGERHAILWTKKGPRAGAYIGPGTRILEKVKAGVKPISMVDRESQAHDIRYSLAKNKQDIRKADLKMIDVIKKKKKEDYYINRKIASIPIKLKMFAENIGIPTDKIATFGTISKENEKMLREQLDKLEQEGYGKSNKKEPSKAELLRYIKDYKKEHCKRAVTSMDKKELWDIAKEMGYDDMSKKESVFMKEIQKVPTEDLMGIINYLKQELKRLKSQAKTTKELNNFKKSIVYNVITTQIKQVNELLAIRDKATKKIKQAVDSDFKVSVSESKLKRKKEAVKKKAERAERAAKRKKSPEEEALSKTITFLKRDLKDQIEEDLEEFKDENPNMTITQLDNFPNNPKYNKMREDIKKLSKELKVLSDKRKKGQ